MTGPFSTSTRWWQSVQHHEDEETTSASTCVFTEWARWAPVSPPRVWEWWNPNFWHTRHRTIRTIKSALSQNQTLSHSYCKAQAVCDCETRETLALKTKKNNWWLFPKAHTYEASFHTRRFLARFATTSAIFRFSLMLWISYRRAV